MLLRDSLLFSIWNYLNIFQKYIGKSIYLIFSFSFIAASAESLGLLFLIPLLQSLRNAEIESNNIFFKFINFKEFSGPTEILLYLFLAFLVKAGFTFATYVLIAKIRSGLLGKIKKIIFKKYSAMKYTYFEDSELGYLSSVINFQVRAMIQSFFFVSQVIVQILNSAILIIIAYLISPIQSLIALIGGILIFLGFNYINKYIKKQSLIYADTESKSSSYVLQFLNSFKYLKATNQIDFFEIPFKRAVKELTLRQEKTGVANSLTLSIKDPLAIFIILLMTLIQVKILNLPIEPLFVSIILFYRALNYVVGTQVSWQQAMEFIGSLEIIDKEIQNLDSNHEILGTRKINDLRKNIVFENINLRVANYKKNLLKNISLTIPKNKTIAFVGPSGAGKSTILDLLTLNKIPSSGNIFIDDINSKEISKKYWRNLIGYVQQENMIFDCTIKQNITMEFDNKKESKISNREMINAAKAANIHEYIKNLPNGYLTRVGDKGTKLSGGQRQRICLARELYRKPKILMLDEATSALDTKNEKIIQKSVENLKGKLTTIIITHRLSSIKFCDYIYVIDSGKVVEEGIYNDLITNSNSYLNKINIENLK